MQLVEEHTRGAMCVCYLHGSAGRRADERRGPHGRGCRQASLPLLLVDTVTLGLRQLQEVLHGTKVDQQRLGCRLGVLLLAQNLRQQTLRDGEGGGRWGQGQKARTGNRSTSVRCLDGKFPMTTLDNPNCSV